MHSRTSGLLLAALALSGCGFLPSPLQPAANTVVAGGANAAANAAVNSANNRPQQGGRGGQQTTGSAPSVLVSLNEHMRQAGYQPVGPAVRNNSLAQNGMIAYALDTQPNRCYSAVALGDDGTDLDLVLLDPQGRTAAHNVAPDSHPFVTFCPRQGGRFVARLQMSQGQGGYYFISFVGPGGSNPQLSRYFQTGGTAVAQGQQGQQGQQTQQPQVAQMDPTTQARVGAVDRRLSRDDFSRVAEPYGIVMAERQDRQFPLNLEAGYCYAFATFGGPGTSDTDVFVVDGSGNELVQDAGTDRDSLVRYCPSAAGAYQLKVRLYSGSGPVFVAGWVQAPEQQVATTNPQGQQGQQGQQTTTTATATVISQESTEGIGLDENFRLRQSDITARGYEPYGDQTRGSLREGETRDFQVNLEGDKCYAILAVGDNGVRNLDLIVTDRIGRALDQDVENDARPIVRTCPTQTGDQTIQVRMTAGSGNFYYAAYRWPRGTSGPFGISGVQWVRLGEMNSLLRSEQFAPSTDLMTLNDRGRLASQGASVTKRLNLQAGRCYAIAVVGDSGITDLGVVLRQNRQDVVGDDSHSAFPQVRTCPAAGGAYELVVSAQGGSGTFVYQVFERGSGN
ncbi:MAG: hypothetical protein U0230_19515 [Polyangiales bacterium]